MSDRRAFLRGLAALPLSGGSVAILGQPTAAAVPMTDELLTSYRDFLAADLREVMIALHERAWSELPRQWPELRRQWDQTFAELVVDLPPPVAQRDAVMSRAAVVVATAGADLSQRRRL